MTGSSTDLPPVLRYRLSYDDWIGWNGARLGAVARRPRYPRLEHGLKWWAYWFSWISYSLTLVAWAALVTHAALLVVADARQVPIFLTALLTVTIGMTIWDANRRSTREAQQKALFAASSLSQGELVLRSTDAGLDVAYAGVSMHVPWASVRSVRRIGKLALIVYDDSLGGIAVPSSAFGTKAQIDGFVAAVEARAAVAGRSQPAARD